MTKAHCAECGRAFEVPDLDGAICPHCNALIHSASASHKTHKALTPQGLAGGAPLSSNGEDPLELTPILPEAQNANAVVGSEPQEPLAENPILAAQQLADQFAKNKEQQEKRVNRRRPKQVRSQAEVRSSNPSKGIMGIVLAGLGVLLAVLGGGLLVLAPDQEESQQPQLLAKIESQKRKYKGMLEQFHQHEKTLKDLKIKIAMSEADEETMAYKQKRLGSRFAALASGEPTMEMKRLNAVEGNVHKSRQAIKSKLKKRLEISDPVKVIARSEKSTVIVVTENGFGSGFLFSTEGYVATNYHVVRGSSELTIRMQKRESKGLVDIKEARIIAVRPEVDLAIIKLGKVPAEVEEAGRYPAVPLRKEMSRTGEEVFIIGNPGLGAKILSYTVSRGIISNPSRGIGKGTMIQTSAPVNPGNSGGPLFDKLGNAIGVVTSKGVGVEAVTFAVPVKILLDLFNNRFRAPFAVEGAFEDWERKHSPLAYLAKESRKKLEKNGIKLKRPASEIILSADGRRIYLIIARAGVIQSLDLRTRKVEHRIDLGAGISDVCLAGRKGEYLYVALEKGSEIIRVKTKSMTEQDRTVIDSEPAMLAVQGIHRNWPVWLSANRGEEFAHTIHPNYLGRKTVRALTIEPPGHVSSIVSDPNWICFISQITNSLNFKLRFYPTQRTWQSMTRLIETQARLRKDPRLNRNYGNSIRQQRSALQNMSKTITLKVDGFTHGQLLMTRLHFCGRDRFIFGKNLYSLGTLISSMGIFEAHPLIRSGKLNRENQYELSLLDNIVSVSRDGKWAASATHIYNVATRKIVKPLPAPSLQHVFSHDGNSLYLLAVGGEILYPMSEWRKNASDVKK